MDWCSLLRNQLISVRLAPIPKHRNGFMMDQVLQHFPLPFCFHVHVWTLAVHNGRASVVGEDGCEHPCTRSLFNLMFYERNTSTLTRSK
jgi:hypothetical protein